jgi:hypothetical protein
VSVRGRAGGAMTAFQNAHLSLAPLTLRELDFLAGIIACRIERLSEFEDEDRGNEEASPELTLAA